MMDLAQKKVIDGDFDFVPWRPHKRARPILVPSPQNTVDDAMEAILEEMDSSVEELDTLEEISHEEIVTEEMEVNEDLTQSLKTLGNLIDSEPSSQPDTGNHAALVDVGVQPAVSQIEDDELPILEQEVVEVELEVEDEIPEIRNSETEVEEMVLSPVSEIENVDSSVFEDLLRSLGLEEDADMLNDDGDISAIRRKIASHVGVEPRDMRLDRILRLSLRLMPKGDADDTIRFNLIKTLSELAGVLSKWTRTRLEARHNGSKGFLIEDAANLGIALERIPGPGTPIPLDADDYELPALDDIEGLANEVNVLQRRIKLTSAGGVR
jgi:hypothetical protein